MTSNFILNHSLNFSPLFCFLNHLGRQLLLLSLSDLVSGRGDWNSAYPDHIVSKVIGDLNQRPVPALLTHPIISLLSQWIKLTLQRVSLLVWDEAHVFEGEKREVHYGISILYKSPLRNNHFTPTVCGIVQSLLKFSNVSFSSLNLKTDQFKKHARWTDAFTFSLVGFVLCVLLILDRSRCTAFNKIHKS